MKKWQSKNVEEITFIGAGIATAYALLGLLENLGHIKGEKPLKIRVLDKHPDFFCGIPYGKRSGNSVLLINALESFIPDPHRAQFIEWLNVNKSELLNEFLSSGGVKSKKWVTENLAEIDADRWESLYIPRFFFGRYISEKVRFAIEQHESQGQIQISYSTGEVEDVIKGDNHFEILLQGGEKIYSGNVVLSLGSLPTKRIFGNENLIREENYLVLNDLYKEDLISNLTTIKDFLRSRQNKETNVLVLGANASGLEAVYKLTDEEEIYRFIDRITVLSSQGVMPDSEIDEAGLKNYLPENLMGMQDEPVLTAEKIANAAYKDLQKAREISLGAASTIEIVSSKIGVLLQRLNEKEAKKFACLYGNNIGRMQRCAGSHYTNSVMELKSENKLEHIAGRFSRLVINNDGEDYLQLEYIDTKTKGIALHPKGLNIVVNCMGATNLHSNDTPALLKNMIDRGLITPNSSEIGIDVNSNFEASEKLYVIGPLLAGNVIEGKPLWHLEHCGRIIWSSGLMASMFTKSSIYSDLTQS